MGSVWMGSGKEYIVMDWEQEKYGEEVENCQMWIMLWCCNSGEMECTDVDMYKGRHTLALTIW